MPNPRLQRTTNYAQFVFTKENRDVDLHHLRPQHQALRKSMQQYGFLPSFPIMVQARNGQLVVIDGQHRLAFAKELGLDVFYVTDDTDVNIATINNAQATWAVKDFANRWAKAGRKDYIEAIQIAEQYGAPIGRVVSMLAGTLNFANVRGSFVSGTLQIKHRDATIRVLETYAALRKVQRRINKARLLEALWACAFVSYFEVKRVVHTAVLRPELFPPSGTRDGYLEILEELYNFGRRGKVPLKFDALQAMAERNPGTAAPKKS